MTVTSGRPQRSAVGLRSERGPVLGAVMLSVSLVALDTTILATAVPSIVQDLGGFSQFPWLFSIYLLTQAVTVPLYGKFADVVGRKPIMMVGIGIFLLGSVLCGIAWSMPVLIAARAIQGIGAGAIQPISMTMIGDMYTVEERARVQGYVASVWAMAAVLGPSLGGLFSEYLSWRWIFFVNVPLGLLAAVVLKRQFPEQVDRRRHSIDYLGAALLTVSCSLIILGLLEGGVAWGWTSPTSVAIFVVGFGLLALFLRVEQRAAEPVLPLWVFRHRVLVGGNLTAVAVGVLLIGLSSYIPTYAQGVLRTGPIEAGFALATLTIGWPIAATLSGRFYTSIGFRDTALIGIVFVVAGSAMTALLGPDEPLWRIAAAMFVTGIGLGLCTSPTLVAVQSAVEWDRRGVVTGTNMFARSIGSALGAAALGGLANATLTDRFAAAPAVIAGELPRSADAASTSFSDDAGQVTEYVRSALFDASSHVFLALLVTAVLMLGAVLLVPRRTKPLRF